MGPREAKADGTVPLGLFLGLSPRAPSAPAPFRPTKPSLRSTSTQTTARVPPRGAALSPSTPRVPPRGAALGLLRTPNSLTARRSVTGPRSPKPRGMRTSPTAHLTTSSRPRRRRRRRRRHRREPRPQVILSLPRRTRRHAASRTCTLPGALLKMVATAVPMTLASHPAASACHLRSSRSLPRPSVRCRSLGVPPRHPPWCATPRLAPHRSS